MIMPSFSVSTSATTSALAGASIKRVSPFSANMALEEDEEFTNRELVIIVALVLLMTSFFIVVPFLITNFLNLTGVLFNVTGSRNLGLHEKTAILGGVIVPKTRELFDRINQALVYNGGTMDPHQSWLALRGVKSLALRVEKSQENAMKLAPYLEEHPKIAWVNYPGLPSHPQHELAKKQMRGFGALLCFGLKGGFEAGETMINSMELAALAVSLGGLESLIQHPASMTHAAIPREKREQAGITDELVRLSVGCESYKDLRADLEQALNKVE